MQLPVLKVAVIAILQQGSNFYKFQSGQKNNTFFSGNTGDEKSFHPGGRKNIFLSI